MGDNWSSNNNNHIKENQKDPIPPHLKELTLLKTEFVVRYNLDPNFKAADADYIIDENIKRIVKSRLTEFNNNPKEAFKNLSENPIWLNKEKQIPIKAIRCFTGLTDLTSLHKDGNGKPIDFRSEEHTSELQSPC